MKKFLLYCIAILVPVFVGIPVVNYIVDPGHVYSEAFIDDVVEVLKQGKNVENVSDLNERVFKEKYIKSLYGKSFDYVIIGASRVMTVSTEDFDSCRIINLGMSGSKLEDLAAIYELCKENDIHYKNVIIDIEPTYFNADDKDTRWKSLETYYNSFAGLSSSAPDYSLITNLFSASYFKSSLSHIIKGTEEIRVVDTKINEGHTKIYDGSITHSKTARECSQSLIDFKAATETHHSFKLYNSLSIERIELFNKLINALRSDSVEITFFKAPYHPIFYKRITKSVGMQKAFNYIDEFAKKNNIPIIGSFNPEDLGLKNTDFYDGTHPRKETVDKLFKN